MSENVRPNAMNKYLERRNNAFASTSSQSRRIKIEQNHTWRLRILPVQWGPDKEPFVDIAQHWHNRAPITCPRHTSEAWGGSPDAPCPICDVSDRLRESGDEKINQLGYSVRVNLRIRSWCIVFDMEDQRNNLEECPIQEVLNPYEFDMYKGTWEDFAKYQRWATSGRRGSGATSEWGLMDLENGADLLATATAKGVRLDQCEPSPIFKLDDPNYDNYIQKIWVRLKKPVISIPDERQLLDWAIKIEEYSEGRGGGRGRGRDDYDDRGRGRGRGFGGGGGRDRDRNEGYDDSRGGGRGNRGGGRYEEDQDQDQPPNDRFSRGRGRGREADAPPPRGRSRSEPAEQEPEPQQEAETPPSPPRRSAPAQSRRTEPEPEQEAPQTEASAPPPRRSAPAAAPARRSAPQQQQQEPEPEPDPQEGTPGEAPTGAELDQDQDPNPAPPPPTRRTAPAPAAPAPARRSAPAPAAPAAANGDAQRPPPRRAPAPAPQEAGVDPEEDNVAEERSDLAPPTRGEPVDEAPPNVAASGPAPRKSPGNIADMRSRLDKLNAKGK